jgi:hypothetical protein
LATINGATDTFEEVRIGTAGSVGTEAIVTVTHRVLVDGLATAG